MEKHYQDENSKFEGMSNFSNPKVDVTCGMHYKYILRKATVHSIMHPSLFPQSTQ